MASEQESLAVDFPKRLSGRWGRFSSADKQFSFVSFCCLLMADVFLGKKGGMLVIVIWFIALLPTDYGRVYTLIGQRIRTWLLRHVRRQQVWSAGEQVWLSQPEPISLAVHGVDDLGLLHSSADTDTVVVTGAGSILSSLEPEGQYDSHAALSDLIRKVAAVHEGRGHNVGWGWLFTTRPLNLETLHSQLSDYLHPQALLPEALELPEPDRAPEDRRWLAFGENIQELLQVTELYGRKVTMAAVCTVPREGLKQDLTPDEARRLPAVQTAELVASELEGCGVIDPRPLTPRDMHAFLRGAWDIRNIGEYYEWQLEHSEEEVLASERQYPQQYIRAGEDYLEIDGSFHAVLWIKNFPDRLYPHHLRQLFDIEVPFLSVALIGSTRSTGLEYAWLDRRNALTGEIENYLGIIHKGPKAEARQQHWLDRQRRIYESRYAQDYNILVAVHHLSREGLEDAVDTALQRIRLANLAAERVAGNIHQLPFLLSATTGIDMTNP